MNKIDSMIKKVIIGDLIKCANVASIFTIYEWVVESLTSLGFA